MKAIKAAPAMKAKKAQKTMKALKAKKKTNQSMKAMKKTGSMNIRQALEEAGLDSGLLTAGKAIILRELVNSVHNLRKYMHPKQSERYA
jgi:hypothetical protein